jgi:segregation and condensation protein B
MPEMDDSQKHGNLILLPGLESEVAAEADAWAVAPDPTLQGEAGSDEEELSPPRPHEMEGAVEAILLAADGPVSENQLNIWLAQPGLGAVRKSLDSFRERLDRHRGGYRLVHVAKGWQLRTESRFAPWVSHMRGGRPFKLSRAALETIAIVAYRQPVTRSEVEVLRGVDSGGVLRMLCERRLCSVLGRKDEPGRPLIYGTTEDFMTLFGLRDLSDLPTLRDLRELKRDDPRDLQYELDSEGVDLDIGSQETPVENEAAEQPSL